MSNQPARLPFIQSRNIKEAQQYLWEGSLSHNSDDTIALRMAVIHLCKEIKNREAVAKQKLADITRLQDLTTATEIPEFLKNRT